jgi:hypothetical protein
VELNRISYASSMFYRKLKQELLISIFIRPKLHKEKDQHNKSRIGEEITMETISEIHNMLGTTVGCPVERPTLVLMASHWDLPASATAQKVFLQARWNP